MINVEELEKKTGKKVRRIKPLSQRTFIIYFEDEQMVVLKERSRASRAYDYLHGQGITNVVYPRSMVFISDVSFYLFDYVEQPFYNQEKAIFDLRDELNSLHEKTMVNQKLKKKHYKQLYRLFKCLDYKFKILEEVVKEAEMREEKSDFDWIILSKYSVFLDVKNEMYQLQMKIHQFVDDGIGVDYCFLHGNPNINHLINRQFVSLENSRWGIVVSDIARYYVLNDDVKIDWFKTIDDWLGKYENEFYKVYFKFLVYYIFILNLHIDLTSEYLTMSNYIFVHSKLVKIKTLFSAYQ